MAPTAFEEAEQIFDGTNFKTSTSATGIGIGDGGGSGITGGGTDDPYLSVPEFYNGRSIFITGGTGFMGKVIFSFNFHHHHSLISFSYPCILLTFISFHLIIPCIIYFMLCMRYRLISCLLYHKQLCKITNFFKYFFLFDYSLSLTAFNFNEYFFVLLPKLQAVCVFYVFILC